MQKKLLIIVIGSAVLAGGGFAAYQSGMFKPHDEVETSETKNEAMPIEAVKVESNRLNRVDKLPGEIYAYQDVAIYPKVPGFIQWIGIDRGSTVKKGQKMVTLIAPELNAQTREAESKAESTKGSLHEAEARLASAKASYLDAKAKMLGDNDTYTRTRDASKIPGVVAENEVIVLREQVSADREKMGAWEQNIAAAAKSVKSLQDSLKAAQQATSSYGDIADYLNITAPFDGYITERNMHVGSFCGPLGKGAYPPIVRIQQLNLLRITTPVPEVDVSGVVEGAPVQFSVSTHPGTRFTGQVARLGNYLDQKTRTMPVELNYWNKDQRVLPGMFCEVFWPTYRQHSTMFVPSTAVETTSTLENFVCRVKPDNVVEWVKVKRGLMMGSSIEVFGDLHDGDVVALKGTDELRPGTKVTPTIVAVKPDYEPAPRPSYHMEGASLIMPESERIELAKPENKGKHWLR